ncbi:MAG: aldo/keto reductase [Rhodospirillaceae bacterium]
MDRSLVSRIALGSVQWGMDYGVANATGKPGAAQVERMLAAARAAGIGLIDTAYAYGDAESLIGKLSQHTAAFEVVTKTGPLPAAASPETASSAIADMFLASLGRLSRPSVHGVLVHNPNILLGALGGAVWSALEQVKKEGLARKIGVSVYEPDQLNAIMARYQIDIVQLPCNVYDRRFLRSGAIAAAKSAGAEVHVRSAFLQGLLLMDAAQLPHHFARIRSHHARLQGWCRDNGTTPLHLALRFCLEQSGADNVVVGAETELQLEEILAAAGKPLAAEVPEAFEVQAIEILNPSLWKL